MKFKSRDSGDEDLEKWISEYEDEDKLIMGISRAGGKGKKCR